MGLVKLIKSRLNGGNIDNIEDFERDVANAVGDITVEDLVDAANYLEKEVTDYAISIGVSIIHGYVLGKGNTRESLDLLRKEIYKTSKFSDLPYSLRTVIAGFD